jgi:hypothetical protein
MPSGKEHLLGGELLEKILDLFRLHLVEENGMKEVTPEQGPFFIFLLHMLPPFGSRRRA